MKGITTLLLLLCSFGWLQAQYSIGGVVQDAKTGETLTGVSLLIKETRAGTISDKGGRFTFKDLSNGNYTIVATYLGYVSTTRSVKIQGQSVSLSFKMESTSTLVSGEDFGEVLVTATKAGKNTPVAYTNLSKEDFEKNNLGVDAPYLLDLTPSAVVTSDAGTGIGYTGIRIRGTDPTRINIQLNGIPLNDSESQGTFWVNLPDFASSVNNIQIQRGVGTSTNGAGAFGASINMETNQVNPEPYATLSNSIGSFNTLKNNISLGTGLINEHWSFDGRLSKISSDGFIDRARADLNSFYLSGAYLGKKNSLRLNVFSGHEITYQAWNGAPLSEIEAGNLTYNPSGLKADGSFHDDEVDNYRQTHYQLHYNQAISKEVSFNAALHYTKGQGYFEQYKVDEDLADYGLDTDEIFVGDSLVETTDLIRRRWLDNDFYGMTFSLNAQPNSKVDLVLGGAINNYVGGHYGEIIWARFAAGSEIRDRYYDNEAEKLDWNVFAKTHYQVTKQLNIFADLQVRAIDYEFLGFDNDGSNITQSDQLFFFNPKLGASFQLDPQNQLYASWAVANREPNRSDYTESQVSQRPRPERLNDFELGYRGNFSKGLLSANLYYMLYKDQLALNGGINDVGEYTRINIPESYRLGIELAGGYQFTDWLNWQANLTLSQNKVVAFTEIVDAFNAPNYELERVELVYTDTDLAFSPNVIAGSDLSFELFDKKIKAGTQKSHQMELSLLTKYVGQQYIDNTSNENANLNEVISNGQDINDRILDAYLINDLRLSYHLNNVLGKKVSLSFLARNILDEQYISNAYAFRFIVDNTLFEGEGYFPQAGRNYLGAITIQL